MLSLPTRVRRGFTLLEVAIAVTIVGIVAALAVAAVRIGTTRAEQAVLQQDVIRIAEAQESYFGATGAFAANAANLGGAAVSEGTDILGMLAVDGSFLVAAQRDRAEQICAVQVSRRSRGTDAGSQVRCADPVLGGAPLLTQMGNAYSFDVSALISAIAAGGGGPTWGPPSVWASGTVEYVVYAFGDGSGYVGRAAEAASVTHTYQGTPATRNVEIGFWTRDGRFLSAAATLPAVGDPALSGAPVAAMTVNPSDTVSVDQYVEFAGGSSRDADGTIVAYAWSVDGQVLGGERLQYRFTTPGSKVVTLTVTDNTARTASTSRTILVTGGGGTVYTPPTALWIASPLPPVVGQPVRLDASASVDPSGRISGVEWQVTGTGGSLTGQTGAAGSTATGLRATAVWTGAGPATIRAIVQSTTGLTDTVTQSFTVLPVEDAPTLVVNASATITRVGSPVTFSATSSAPSSGGTVRWTFGDGSQGNGLAANHTYQIPGTYTVRATATTASGLATQGTTVLTVVPNALPVASFTRSPAGDALIGETITFDANASFDPDGTITLYRWLFSDGVYATGPVVTRSFASGGTYTATLTVRDDARGERTVGDPITVNGLPIATFTHPAILQEGTSHTFDGSGSTDPAGGVIFRYVWTWPDGTTDSSAVATISKALPGTVAPTAAVTLTVRSTSGFSGSITRNIPLNRPPTAGFTWLPATALMGESTDFTSTATDPDGDALTYSWTFAGSGPITGATPSHTFAAGGLVTVSVTVTDGRGGTATETDANFRVAAIPTGVLTVAPDTMVRTVAASFTVSGSADTDAGATIARYIWTIDGVVDSTTNATRLVTLNTAGTTAISVQIRDSFGLLSAPITHSVLVRNAVAPIASLSIGTSVGATLPLAADGAGSTTDPLAGTTIVRYLWDWGDGRTDSTVVASTSVTWPAAGSYVVALRVRDALGQVSAPSTVTVTVTSGPSASFTVAPTPPIRGSVATLTSTATSPQGYSLHYRWLVDGVVLGGDEATPAWTPSAKGAYSLRLIVWDDFGGLDTSAVVVATAIGQAPSSASLLGAPATGTRGTPTTLLAGAVEPDGDPVTFSFEAFDGAAWIPVPPGSGGMSANGVSFAYVANGDSLRITPSTLGAVTFRVIASDIEGDATSGSGVLTVGNTAPTCGAVGAAPTSFAVGGSTTLSVACSDIDGDVPLTYSWTSSDGHSSSATGPAWTFASPGVKTINLTVTDALGATVAASRTVTVTNGAPTCGVIGYAPGAPVVGNVVNMSATCTDPEGGALTYAWTGPGGFSSAATAPTYTWGAATSGTLSLTVTDPWGATVNVTTPITIGSGNTAPVCGAISSAPSPADITEGDVLSLTSNCTDADAITYSWAWPDGGTTTGASTNRTLNSAHAGWVTLTATDTFGATTTVSIYITVSAPAPPPNTPPSAAIVSPGMGAEWSDGETVTLDGTASDVDGGMLIFRWYFDGALVASGVTSNPGNTTASVVAPTPMPAGGVVVRLEVEDDVGAVTGVERTALKSAAPPPCDIGAPWLDSVTGFDYIFGPKRYVNWTVTLFAPACEPDTLELQYLEYGTGYAWAFWFDWPGSTTTLNQDDEVYPFAPPFPQDNYRQYQARYVKAGSATSPSVYQYLLNTEDYDSSLPE